MLNGYREACECRPWRRVARPHVRRGSKGQRQIVGHVSRRFSCFWLDIGHGGDDAIRLRPKVSNHGFAPARADKCEQLVG